MDILFLLIPLSVVLVLLIGLAFWWSVHSGQFEDLEGPAHRILMDDDLPSAREITARPGAQPGNGQSAGSDDLCRDESPGTQRRDEERG